MYTEREDSVHLIIQEGCLISLQVGEGNPLEKPWTEHHIEVKSITLSHRKFKSKRTPLNIHAF